MAREEKFNHKIFSPPFGLLSPLHCALCTCVTHHQAYSTIKSNILPAPRQLSPSLCVAWKATVWGTEWGILLRISSFFLNELQSLKCENRLRFEEKRNLSLSCSCLDSPPPSALLWALFASQGCFPQNQFVWQRGREAGIMGGLQNETGLKMGCIFTSGNVAGNHWKWCRFQGIPITPFSPMTFPPEGYLVLTRSVLSDFL